MEAKGKDKPDATSLRNLKGKKSREERCRGIRRGEGEGEWHPLPRGGGGGTHSRRRRKRRKKRGGKCKFRLNGSGGGQERGGGREKKGPAVREGLGKRFKKGKGVARNAKKASGLL